MHGHITRMRVAILRACAWLLTAQVYYWQSCLQDTLPGLNLEPGKVRPPDLDTAVAVLEAHGDQVTIANISSISNIGQGKVN